MARLTPEDRATKWSLVVGYNTDSADIEPVQMEDTTKSLNVANYVWDTTTLAWVKQVQNVLVTDSIYLAVDGVEALLTSILADTAAIQTAVEIIDDWDESNRAKVNLIAGQAGITGGAGAVGASTPRVTLANDDPAVTSLATIAGCVGADSNFYVEIAGVETEILASTTTPLNATSSWTSGELNVYHYSTLNVYAESDKAGSIKIEFSHDGTNWRSHTFVVPAGTGFHTVRPVGFIYSRVTYTNGAQAQTRFVCYISGNPTALSNPMQRIEDELEGDQLAVVTRGIIAGETTAGGGAYVNVKVNPSGTLEVNANQPDTEWAVQWSEGLTAINNFAAAVDTDFNALLTWMAANDTDFGTMIGHLSAIQTAVQIMDDWDTNDRCRVSPISGQDGVAGNTGALSATTQRVTIATDDPMKLQLDTDFGAALAYLATIATETADTNFTEANSAAILSAISTLNADMDTNFDVTQASLAALESYAAVVDTNWDSLLTWMAANDTDFGAMIALLTTIDSDTSSLRSDIGTMRVLQQDWKKSYFLGGWLVDGANVYVGKEDKAGNYMIIKHATDTGVVTYEGGSGGLPASSGWAAMAYQAYSAEF